MIYTEELITENQLKSAVLCIWQLEGDLPDKPLRSRYIPKGQSLLVYNYDNPRLDLSQYIVDADGKIFICPASPKSIMLDQIGCMNLCGISFIHDGLYRYFERDVRSIDAANSSGKFLELRNLFEKVKDLDLTQKKDVLEAHLSLCIDQEMINPSFDHAMHLISQTRGGIRVKDISKKLDLSNRQLQRLFKSRLGISPKDYCKIVRVNNYINILLERTESIDWMDIVVEFDYHDQPHLINEVKSVAQMSPQALLDLRDTLAHHYQH